MNKKHHARVEKVGVLRCQRLSALLYKHDLENLVPCDVPADEYDYEALLVLEETESGVNLTEERVLKILADVFARMFAVPGNESKRVTRALESPKFAAAAKDAMKEILSPKV